MYSRESVGPRMEPCETSALMDILVKTSHPEPLRMFCDCFPKHLILL